MTITPSAISPWFKWPPLGRVPSRRPVHEAGPKAANFIVRLFTVDGATNGLQSNYAASSSFTLHTWSAIPASIAGVTRKEP
jgi:hypothetical protein